MRIEHAALWTNDIERSREFYVKYFGGTASSRYTNTKTNFESYFISFEPGARLEIMQQGPSGINTDEKHIGFSHIAFSVGSAERVDSLTESLKSEGFTVVSGPRHTGDGYYESCVLDPDGNRVEITV